MEHFSLGRKLREYRKRQHLTQAQVCDGLCEVATLSRIESGKFVPSEPLLRALVGRLGVSSLLFNLPADEGAYRRLELRLQINSLTVGGDFEIGELLEQFKGTGKLDMLDEQWYAKTLASFRAHHGASPAETLAEETAALRLTLPGWTVETPLDDHLLSEGEVTLLNNIAGSLAKAGAPDRALGLSRAVLRYMETHDMAVDFTAMNYPVFAHNLAKTLLCSGHAEDALSLAEKGLDCCAKYGAAKRLYKLLELKARCLLALDRRQEAVPVLRDYLVVARLTGFAAAIAPLGESLGAEYGEALWQDALALLGGTAKG